MPSNVPALAGASTAGAPQPRPASEAAGRTVEAHDPARLPGKELSGLEFAARVLEEARDPALPVLDRLRLLSIFSTKLDELFMVRVAGLRRRPARNGAEPRGEPPPSEQLDRIAARTRELLELEHAAWRDGILPTLASAGIRIVGPADLLPPQREAVRDRFVASVFPALTPLAVDPGHPFPRIRGESLNLAVSLPGGEGRRRRRASLRPLAVVEVPSALPRLVSLPSGSGEEYALLEEIVAASIGDLFPGHAVGETAVFRVTRRRVPDGGEAGSDGIPSAEPERRRDRGPAVRLEISAGASRDIEAALLAALKLEPRDAYRVGVPLQIADLLAVGGGRAHPR